MIAMWRAAVLVLVVMVASFLGYRGSGSLEQPALRVILATSFGASYFLSVCFGTLYIYLVAHLAGVPLRWRVLACSLNPFLWMTKEVIWLLESHPLVECLYWYLNPLNFELACIVALEMGIGATLARAIRKRRGEVLPATSPGAMVVILGSLALMISPYVWEEGERVYVEYLEGYRWLFGPGVQASGRDRADLTGGVPLDRDDRALSSKTSPHRPNIVFILGDNHNANDMAAAGHPFLQTPGLDRLASEGVRFSAAYNTTPLCSPSRASILTGAYAQRHGVLNNHTPWTGQMPTFLEHLSASGYDTAFIGKWHMPGEGLPDMPYLELFVSYTVNEGQGRYFDCPMIVNGEEVKSRAEYITTEVTDYAIEFMERDHRSLDGSGRPFAVYLSHRVAHPRFQSPADITGMYDDVEVCLPPEADPVWFGKTRGNVFQGVMMGSYHDQYRRYCETITAMDRDIVRLLDKIDELGLRESTLVVYMGDNGMQWGAHGRHGIREAYQDAVRLPLIIRAPWLIPDPGAVRPQLALNIDMSPSFLDAAGLAVPDEMDGESLVPILRDPGRSGRAAFLLEFWRYFPENTPSYRGVVTQRYKYIEFERGRGPWLFDLAQDPEEQSNLYGTSAGQRLLPEVERRLAELQAGVGAR
jgi:N-acetylglucosamine-6-sulfatase